MREAGAEEAEKDVAGDEVEVVAIALSVSLGATGESEDSHYVAKT